MRQAQTGDTVRLHYRGTLADGTEFDSSAGRDPVEVTIGGGRIIQGLEDALIGMAEGDTKDVTLEPDSAYGQQDPDLIHVVERARIPAEIELDLGVVISATDPSGGEIRMQVVDLDDDNVTLDANHPLAGRALTFQLNLVAFVG